MNKNLSLKKLKTFSGRPGPVMLIIMDGIGLGNNDDSNAVFLAKTPNLKKYLSEGLSSKLKAHGTAVGLPSDDDMGNSEVGHNTLGSGRIVAQGAQLVNQEIESKKIFNSTVWQDIKKQTEDNNSSLHFIGLLSDGNVHSHIDQLFALINQAATDGIKKVRVHILLDGRDVGEKSALIYIEKLENLLNSLKQKGLDYQITSGGGRMVNTMDRYFADWSVVKRGWDAHVLGKARQFAYAKEAVETYYAEDPKITDQYLPAFVIAKNGLPVGKIIDNDAVVFFNFRGDRAIEISMAFDQKNFNYFDRQFVPKVYFAGIMQYDGDLKIPKNYLVNPPQINNTLGEYLCSQKVTSFAISETQKFGHVTYFWNGNNSGYISEELEKYIEITSDRIAFDQAPKMKAKEICDKTLELLESKKYKFGRLNFANGDMVGHTGNLEATIIAVETVDECMGKIVEKVKALNGVAIITADHGNADEMFTVSKNKKAVRTAHTLNPVPFIIVDPLNKGEYKLADVNDAGLANVASTICNLLGFEAPKDYEPSLISFE